ncbi:MAG: DUF4388 domain-containing protein [Planctomycetes bacterium]|nr:DUF4388 domain-containing protein [Planctomycetota bacterium]
MSRILVVARARGLAGAEAVYEMLTWSEGAFEFRGGDVHERDEVRATTASLLLEGAQRMDER